MVAPWDGRDLARLSVAPSLRRRQKPFLPTYAEDIRRRPPPRTILYSDPPSSRSLYLVFTMIAQLALLAIVPALAAAQVGGCGGVLSPDAYCTTMMGPGYTCSGTTCVTTAAAVGGCGGLASPDAFCTSQYGPGYTCSGIYCVPTATTTPPLVGGCAGLASPDAF